jgi:hypothetical protein
MEPIERINRSLKRMLLNNFLGGMAWGLGATVGLSVFVAILTLILKQINLVPIVGEFLSKVIEYMMHNNSTLQL